MNYYIQGDAANADKIKAAFEKNGIDTSANSNYGMSNLFYFSCNGEVAVTQNRSIINIIKTHPDYQELELPGEPKPHYDISNFQPKQWVLVRQGDGCVWRLDIFSNLKEGAVCQFECVGNSMVQCIPFEGNEHLLGTTDMCDEKFINW